MGKTPMSDRLARKVQVLVWALALACLAWGSANAPSAASEPQAASVMERFDVQDSRPAFGGARFSEVGDYQFIRAKAHVRVTPGHRANRGIVDLDKAPKTASGEVLYTADVVILRPRDPARARRVMIAEVPNRGRRLALGMLNDANLATGASAAPPFSTAEEAGAGFLLRRGYTLVWVGWQGDLPIGGPLMRADLPVATANGKPITGRVEATAVFDAIGPQYELNLAYAAAPGAEGDAELTVRPRADAPRTTLPRSSWSFINPKKIRIERAAEADAGAIYQFVYTATDPIVAGLGFAATRDVVSYLRRGERDGAGTPNPLLDLRSARCASESQSACEASRGHTVDLVIGSGASQSGRYLRDMIWQGFNDDGSGGRVFDGLLVQVAGSRKTFTNRRWAEPGRFSRQHEDPLVYGNQFPFSYGITTDPTTGSRDGVFSTCARSGTCPKVFHIDGSAEFWSAGASLVTTDGAGRDLSLPPDVRAYMIAGAPHAPGMAGASSLLPPNPLLSAPAVRALLVAMDDWLIGVAEPPPSRWPSVAKGELAVPASRDAVGFPDFRGMPYSGAANPVVLTDYDAVPPRPDRSRAWRVLVPTTDSDGNDRAGVHLPEFAAPQGAYLGWNPRKAGYAEGQLSFVFGAFVPFATTAEARAADNDPRLSLRERYRNGEARQQRLEAARRHLRAERLYLDASD
jgi:hypothetical protein